MSEDHDGLIIAIEPADPQKVIKLIEMKYLTPPKENDGVARILAYSPI